MSGREELDAYCSGRPVYLPRLGYVASVNSRGLRAAGIHPGSPSVVGGDIVRRPDGELQEAPATRLVSRLVSEPSRDEALQAPTELFGTCRALLDELSSIAEVADQDTAVQTSRPRSESAADEERFEAVRSERLRIFREVEDERRERLHLVARRAFERTDLLAWDSILDVPPPQRLGVETPCLEGATRDTYFAIDRATAVTQ